MFMKAIEGPAATARPVCGWAAPAQPHMGTHTRWPGPQKEYELLEVFRQRDQQFVSVLNKVRMGEVDQPPPGRWLLTLFHRFHMHFPSLGSHSPPG